MKNQYFKSFVTQTIQFIILYLLFRSSTNEPWFQNKLRDTVVLLLSYIVFMIVPLFGWLFRPLVISVKQENKLGKAAGNTQILKEKNELKTPANQRTVNLTVEITRRGSVWWRFLMWRLKSRELKIIVEATPAELNIQGTDFVRLNEINITEKGFQIKLNSLLQSLNERTGSFTIAKSFPYFVTDHPDIHIPHNLSASVQPVLVTNGKKSFFTKLLIHFITEVHQIYVFKR